MCAPAGTPPPASAPRRSRLKVLVIVAAALVALAALIAGGLWAYDRFRDEGIDYSDLEVGDCFNSSASNEIRGIKVQPCEKPHNSEIFFLVNHPAGSDAAYPGKDALVQFAADACLGQPLTEYLGIPLEQSALKDFEIVPQQSAWDDGKRVLVCGLDTGGEADVTGSIMGSRR
ncbi:MAG: septum formation family protein [Acidimicrobiales bacterium]